MTMLFRTPDYLLSDLMNRARNGRIQLLDFQREWKWDDDRIVSLLSSVAMGHPIGVIMMLEVGSINLNFGAKPIPGTEQESIYSPRRLLLDGQHRMTSLFQALASNRPVQTRDKQHNPLNRWYYIDIAKALIDSSHLEGAIRSIPEDRIVQDDFGKSVTLDLSTRNAECKAEMFPLANVFDSIVTNEWVTHYAQLNQQKIGYSMQRWSRFQEEVLINFTKCKVPVISLTKDIPKDAVCKMFEQSNTHREPLDVFELLIATFAAQGFNLKKDWDARQKKLRKREINSVLKSSDFLQAVTLLAARARRISWTGSERNAPVVSCRRKDILNLTLDEYQQWADAVTDGFEWAAVFLMQEGIFTAKDIPYVHQLVPMAAIRATLGATINKHSTIKRIHQWYWCGVLGELYDQTIEARFAWDLEEVVAWIQSNGPTPRTVEIASFNSSRLLTLHTRDTAAYKGIQALLIRNGCLDWQKHEPMSMAPFYGYSIDVHHIFPKAWCNMNSVDHTHSDSIVNMTTVSSGTKRHIGSRAPSEYLPILERYADISSDLMDKTLEGHGINARALREDNFALFFEDRKRKLIEIISDAIVKPVTVDDHNTWNQT